MEEIVYNDDIINEMNYKSRFSLTKPPMERAARIIHFKPYQENRAEKSSRIRNTYCETFQ